MLERPELEAFLTLTEELHFGRTADRMHVSTGRVSQIIRKLERRVGAPLFERNSRGVALTPLGLRMHEEVLPAARQLRTALHNARARARGLEPGPEPPVLRPGPGEHRPDRRRADTAGARWHSADSHRSAPEPHRGETMAALIRIRHVKIPVTDLARSVAWYRDLLRLTLAAEFRDRGQLRGAQLMDASGFGIALREREFCARKPDLAGFDVVALEVGAVADLHELAARAGELGAEHTGVTDRGAHGAVLDLIDPDGTVVRVLANNPLHPDRFVGVDSDAEGSFTLYDTPVL